MLSRRTKATFYFLAAPLMRLNGLFYRVFRAPRRGDVRIHLGPGQRNYIDGWINVDANMFTGKCDLWADLRNKLPFLDDTVEAAYSHHMIEHLPDLPAHFREVFRCLKPGGAYRVAGPNGVVAIAKFLAGDKAWFGNFPDNRSSIGDRLENFIFCRQEHLTILTESYLSELMTETGFVNLKSCRPVIDTYHPGLFAPRLEKESESDMDAPHTIVLEGEKPGGGRD